MSIAYKQKKRYVKRIRDLYLAIDTNDSNSISLNEFFELIDVLEENPKWHLPMFPDSQNWNRFRKYLNRKIKLKLFAKSTGFEGFMFLVLIVNCVVIIAAAGELSFFFFNCSDT